MQLSLLQGPHIPAIRFEAALAELDLDRARADCPEEWCAALDALRAARSPEAILAARTPGWPEGLERAWLRTLGRTLAAKKHPGSALGDPAGAFLLRGGEPEAAKQALVRHLAHAPADADAWAWLAQLEPFPASVRAAWHEGEVLPVLDALLARVEEEGLEPPARWLLPYAWLDGRVSTDDLSDALRNEALPARPLPLRGDATLFTFYLVEVEDLRAGRRAVDGGLAEGRRRLKIISECAFRRYLARIGAG